MPVFMKHLMRGVALLAAALLVGGSFAALADIESSAHDFSTSGWNSTGEICIVCHTPHNADQTVANMPLWNHEVTMATYIVYSSSTMDATVGQPGGASKLCLSCHDGTVAIDSFGGGTGGIYIGGRFLIGTDLSDDHPVSIEWDHSTTNDQTPLCLGCHLVHANMAYVGPPFFDGRLECATCHDVHNQGPPEPGLLRRTMAGSDLCLWCHGK